MKLHISSARTSFLKNVVRLFDRHFHFGSQYANQLFRNTNLCQIQQSLLHTSHFVTHLAIALLHAQKKNKLLFIVQNLLNNIDLDDSNWPLNR